MEGLFHGNLAQERASSTMETLENILKTNSRSKPLLPSQLKRQREIQLPDGEIKGKVPIDTLFIYWEDHDGVWSEDGNVVKIPI